MLTLWMIAGFIIGWISIDFLGIIFRMHTPISFNICMGYVGSLVSYTFFI